MKLTEIADSQISYCKEQDHLITDIPSHPHFNRLWKIGNKNFGYWIRNQEGIFIESLISSMLIFISVYLIPIATLQKIFFQPDLLNTWFIAAINVFFLSHLSNLVYSLNGSARIELTPDTLRLHRKIHLFGCLIKIRTVDIEKFQSFSWKRILQSESESRALCVVAAKRRTYRVGRAVSQVEQSG